MVSGGHKADDVGIDVTNIFDPASETWTPGLPKMALGRWYPTVTTLADGRVLTMAGRDSAGNVVTMPEIWENNHWVELPGAGTLNIPYYPRNFVAPDGRIFMAGERVMSRWFDVDAARTASGASGPTARRTSWRSIATTAPPPCTSPGRSCTRAEAATRAGLRRPTPGRRADGDRRRRSTSMPATRRGPVPASMAFPRRHLNSTILPDGTVLVTGGTTGGGFVDINPGDAARSGGALGPEDQPVAHAGREQRDARVSLGLAPAARRHRASRGQRQRPGGSRAGAGRGRTTRSSRRRICSRAPGPRSRARRRPWATGRPSP